MDDFVSKKGHPIWTSGELSGWMRWPCWWCHDDTNADAKLTPGNLDGSPYCRRHHAVKMRGEVWSIRDIGCTARFRCRSLESQIWPGKYWNSSMVNLIATCIFQTQNVVYHKCRGFSSWRPSVSPFRPSLLVKPMLLGNDGRSFASHDVFPRVAELPKSKGMLNDSLESHWSWNVDLEQQKVCEERSCGLPLSWYIVGAYLSH